MDTRSEPQPGRQSSDATFGMERVERAGVGFLEFIVLLAALSSIVALSIDIMLPALPLIGESFAITDENDRQAVITVFMLGFGVAQILFGPVSDRFGRKIVLIPAILLYAVAAVADAFAGSFTTLLLLRLAQGICAAAVRIIVNAMVRDCFGGRDMARVMSYTFTVFMIVPIVAPAIGQAIVGVASWQWIFVFLGVAGLGLAVWSGLRIRETLPEEERLPLSFAAIGNAFREVISNRLAMGYTLASTLCFGGLFAFVVSAQQIFQSVYDLGHWFAFAFALNAGIMAVLNFTNGSLVRRVGMRLISHSALIAFAALGTLLLIICLFGTPPFLLAYLILAAIAGAFGLVPPNFNALAMEPLGHIAGTASSVMGVISFTGGAVLGALVGQAFDGTLIPLAAGYAVFGWTAFGIIVWTEKGRLFVRAEASA
ncbi:multidrug effflux MFS transporter [Hoeflea sp. E7-10]|uniref:Bcr/CflA family efflux transporter n=2 Tax=Hoeflea poritis TaxID=2993659 RepID=A0ABT4VUD2_9HYPH|nr:multidrug effflux MFS transporter [Hoeflea poritis]MDA4848229.1 multidrug effflux MFS transporter [Hoeflea poritis]